MLVNGVNKFFGIVIGMIFMIDMIMVFVWFYIIFILVLYYYFFLELLKIEVIDGCEFIFESCYLFLIRRRYFYFFFNM